jgi:hypothetical protein
MTMLIIDTSTATTAATTGVPRVRALAGRLSDADWSCMAVRIIGTGRPGVHPNYAIVLRRVVVPDPCSKRKCRLEHRNLTEI